MKVKEVIKKKNSIDYIRKEVANENGFMSFKDYILRLSNLSIIKFNKLTDEDKNTLIKWYIEDILEDVPNGEKIDFWSYIEIAFELSPEQYKELDVEDQIDIYRQYAEYKELDTEEKNMDDILWEFIEEAEEEIKNERMAKN